MFSLGGSEILVLGILALLLFGNKNLPENMKKMVKGLNEVKRVANDAQRSWHEIRDDVTRQIMADEAAEAAKRELEAVKRALAAPAEGTVATDAAVPAEASPAPLETPDHHPVSPALIPEASLITEISTPLDADPVGSADQGSLDPAGVTADPPPTKV